MSERAGSRVGKQLEDRSVGKCATTTDREPRCTRGKKEKELVKKDGVRSMGQGEGVLRTRGCFWLKTPPFPKYAQVVAACVF